MNIADVMDELAEALGAIPDLRVFAYPEESVSPPVAMVLYPDEYTYDATYGRGMDELTVPVLLIVARTVARTARDQLAAYMDGDGDRSVKAAIDGHTPTAYDTARVVRCEPGSVKIAGTEYLSALFDVDITGNGAS